MLKIVLAALALTLAIPGAALSEPIIIDHVTLIDGTGRAPRQDQVVMVDDGRFRLVGPSVLGQGLSGRRIDGHGKYLIPGLIDIHIHLAGFSRGGKPWSTGSKTGEWVVDRKAGEQALASFLYAGVTTVLDVGNIPE
jgi:imidazolonepropionase-like amidohydrolase